MNSSMLARVRICLLEHGCQVSVAFFVTFGHKSHRFMAKQKNPHAVALSKLGAKKGGNARAAALSAEDRREIARKASLARWAKQQKKKTEST
jgi:hypothetical protein